MNPSPSRRLSKMRRISFESSTITMHSSGSRKVLDGTISLSLDVVSGATMGRRIS